MSDINFLKIEFTLRSKRGYSSVTTCRLEGDKTPEQVLRGALSELLNIASAEGLSLAELLQPPPHPHHQVEAP